MVPALVALAHMPQKRALGTSLVAATVVGGVSAMSYAKEGMVDIVAAASVAAGSAMTARLGAQFAQGLPDKTLKTVLGIYMLLMAAVVPARKSFLESARANRKSADATAEDAQSDKGLFERIGLKKEFPVYFGTGLFAGIASGIFGIAGGTIVTPTLVVFSTMTQPEGQFCLQPLARPRTNSRS